MWDVKRDPYNVASNKLYADTAGGTVTSPSVDFVSNGFKFRANSGAFNTTGQTNIFIAFAESPFKTSNAR